MIATFFPVLVVTGCGTMKPISKALSAIALFDGLDRDRLVDR
jgi:hypothetical protein